MNTQLTNKLHKTYPEIFKNGNEMFTYFECYDGWYELIDSLCAELMDYCKKFNREPPKASQVKEKFGSLRFYVWYANNEMYDIIQKYELQSQYTCEICGNRGSIKKIRGWYTCFCDRHYAERLGEVYEKK